MRRRHKPPPGATASAAIRKWPCPLADVRNIRAYTHQSQACGLRAWREVDHSDNGRTVDEAFDGVVEGEVTETAGHQLEELKLN